MLLLLSTWEMAGSTLTVTEPFLWILWAAIIVWCTAILRPAINPINALLVGFLMWLVALGFFLETFHGMPLNQVSDLILEPINEVISGCIFFFGLMTGNFVSVRMYGVLLANKGRNHLRFLQAMSDLPDLDSAKAEYDFALKNLQEHKKSCKGCTF